MPATSGRASDSHSASRSPAGFNLARPQFQYAPINPVGEPSQMPAPYPLGQNKILNRLIWLFAFLSIIAVTLYLVFPVHDLLLGANPRILKIATAKFYAYKTKTDTVNEDELEKKKGK